MAGTEGDPRAVVLPSGGGALRGMGESFEADLQSGEGRARVPVVCPPGRNGFGPDLALGYSAKSGNGPFGVGWSLSLGQVSRSTRHGLPTYGASDTFVLSGDDLVEVPEGSGTRNGVNVTRYRLRVESAFARIVHSVGKGLDEWEVISRDGISTVFGAEPDSRIADEDGQGARVFAWLPSVRRDRLGNRIVFRYRRDRGQGTDGRPLAEKVAVECGHRYNQVYLSQVAYVELGTESQGTEPRFLYSVDFDYGEPDPVDPIVLANDWAYREEDPFSSFRAGFEVRTARRCRGIFVRVHEDSGPQTVRAYRLDYAAAGTNNASLLKRITVLGGTAETKPPDTLPPLTFQYTEFDPSQQQQPTLYVTCPGGLPFASFADSGIEIADIEENGLAGLLRLGYAPPDGATGDNTATAWQPLWCPNRGHGTLASPRPHPATPGLTLGSPGTRMADVLGTGIPQLVRFSGAQSRVFPSRPDGFAEARMFPQPPQFDPADPDVQLVDVDGDGVIDALRVTQNLIVVHHNDVNRGWEQFPAKAGPGSGRGLSDPRMRLADVSGDGPLDLVELTEGAVRYWPHLGWGRFGPPITFADSPSLGTEFDPQRMLFADVDGDGYADLIYLGDEYITVWLNQSGNRFAKPFKVLNTPKERTPGAVRAVDWLGNGTVGLLWSLQHPASYYPVVRPGDANVSGVRTVQFLLRSNPGPCSAIAADGVFGPQTEQAVPLFQEVNGLVVDRVVGQATWRELVATQRDGSRGEQVRAIQALLNIYGLTHVGCRLTEDGIFGPLTRAAVVRFQRAVGITGDGVVGLVTWPYLVDQAMRVEAGIPSSLAFVDLTGGVKPYLLRGMDNACGAVTQVEYAPSTTFFLADADAGLRWRTSLPFPVQVVSRVVVDDVFSGSRRTSEYRYHHGCWDGTEREFRGFGRADQLDGCSFGAFTKDRPAGSVPVPEGHFSPPTETRTWFHIGPVSHGDGSWNEADFRDEYWTGDQPLLTDKRTSDDLRVIASPGSRMYRDAARGLHGRVLRTESYACDGTPRADRPYAVAEYQYEVVGIRDGRDKASWERAPVVTAREVGQRSTVWDRGDDPMTTVSFTGEYDEFGQPRRRSRIALPRRSLARQPVTGTVVGPVQPDETAILATHTHTAYATPPAGVFLCDRVAEVRTYELAAPPTVAERDIKDLSAVLTDQMAAASAVHAQFLARQDVRLIGHTVNYYDGQPFDGLPAGQAGDFGALTRTCSLVATSAVLDAAYTAAGQQRRPRYLGGPVQPPTGVPADFGSDLGYLPQNTAPGDGYYADTLRRRYDFQQPQFGKAHGLVTATRDPRGAQTDIRPDDYWLLPELITDVASGITTEAKYDYRTQQPICLTDGNGNQSHMTYTSLGLPAAGWATGKNREGGSADHPDVTFTYELLAYLRTRNSAPPQRPQPISVRTCRRVWHASNPVSDETISTWEYSDGFGRLLQKRAHAGELAFGKFPEDQHDIEGVQKPREVSEPAYDATGDDTGLPAAPGTPAGEATGQRQPRRVVVSGWQVYDNKGRVVQAYEPFFGLDASYRWPEQEPQGHRVDTYYDPRGNVIRTLRPDGTQSRVVFGVPRKADALILTDTDLTRFPAGFTPSPWETYTYDANDLAGLSTDPDTKTCLDADVPADHAFTPGHAVADSLGRVRCQVIRNGPVPADGWMITRFGYDIRGNLLTVTDPLGRTAFSHSYDLLNRRLATTSIDGGSRNSVLDAVGSPVEDRTSAGSITLRRYDLLNRLIEVWACDSGGQQVTLRERLTYGDQGTAGQNQADRQANRDRYRLGRLAVHDDEAGTVEFDRYDFKGNLVRKTRRVISDTELEIGWTANWAGPNPERALDPARHVTDTEYDALNRPVRITYPDTGTGRPVVETAYDRAGAIERVSLDGTPDITQIAYNAKGQVVLARFGNNTFTRYAYDPRNFRLLRQRSERCKRLTGDTWVGHGSPLQDFTYRYDPAGNVTCIEERVLGCGTRSTPQPSDEPDPVLRHLLATGDALVRSFTHDPLYRLTAATGRACTSQEAPRSLDDVPRCGYQPPGPATPTPHNAPDLSVGYREQYSYDPAGNLVRLDYRTNDDKHHWSRRYTCGPPGQQPGQPPASNQLTALDSGSTTATYRYDANGNLIAQNYERRHTWDHANRMTGYAVQAGQTATLDARYLYAADGTRVKKWVRKNGSTESTTYLDGVLDLHDWTDQGTNRHNGIIHLQSKTSRLVSVRYGPAHRDDPGPERLYHLADHLGSSHLALDDTGTFLNREEYFPYGETSFGSYAKKRYRYIGAERDEESGLYHMPARYYSPWLCRWTNPDPGGLRDGINLYCYVQDNPLDHKDPTGLQKEDPQACIPQPAVTGTGSNPITAREASSGQAAADGKTSSSQSRSLSAGTRPDGSTDWWWVAKETFKHINPFTGHATRVNAVNAVLERNANALQEAGVRTDSGEKMLSAFGFWASAIGGLAAAKFFGPMLNKAFMPEPSPSVSAPTNVQAARQLGKAQETMARFSLRNSAVAPPEPIAGNRQYALKSLETGKTLSSSPGSTSGCRIPDCYVAGRPGSVGTVETKIEIGVDLPTDPKIYVLSHPEAAEQLSREAGYLLQAPVGTGPASQLVPIDPGEGIGLTTGSWIWSPPHQPQ